MHVALSYYYSLFSARSAQRKTKTKTTTPSRLAEPVGRVSRAGWHPATQSTALALPVRACRLDGAMAVFCTLTCTAKTQFDFDLILICQGEELMGALTRAVLNRAAPSHDHGKHSQNPIRFDLNLPSEELMGGLMRAVLNRAAPSHDHGNCRPQSKHWRDCRKRFRVLVCRQAHGSKLS